MFGPRQVGEVIVGKAFLDTVKKYSDFKGVAVDGDIALVDAGSKGEVMFVQKTNGDSAKNLDFEFTDRINPKSVERINVKAFKPEVQSVWEITGFDGADFVKPLRTYEISIKVEGDISPQNYDIIFGYYTTGEVIGADTKETILNGLVESINKDIKRRGNFEFTVVADTDKIVVTEKYQANVYGKKDGRKLLFRVFGKVFNNIATGYNGDLGYLVAKNTVKPSVGTGTGKAVTNYEWFCKGYKYDPNREYAYPINFEYPMYASKNGEYDVVQVIYFRARTETIVERQYRVLSIFVEKGKTVELAKALKALAEKHDIDFDTDLVLA